tara:strand:- start:104661 stop:105005 length:345 start_codon:yes stop_codon:yes gene_type:complete
MSEGKENPASLEPDDDNEDTITIDEFIELYVEFRGVLFEKEKKKYGKGMLLTSVREASSLFKLWFIDMTDREMIHRLKDLDPFGDDDNVDDDDDDNDDDDQSDPDWWKKTQGDN